MRISLSHFSLLALAILALSCATLSKPSRQPAGSGTHLLLPPDVLAEMEINRVRALYDNLPDFVAYGTYTMTFMFNRSKGKFKMYKLSDTIYVKLDDNRTFVIPWDTLINTDVRDGRMELREDTVVITWDGNEVVLVDDRLTAYRGRGILLRMEDYALEPIPHPRRLILRSMGVSVVLVVDSIVPLP